jgi:acetyltransferase-like isoleucine patch superfamily enzyme
VKISEVFIVGGSDPWVSEIIDCAIANGISPKIARGLSPVAQLENLGPTEVVDLSLVNRESFVFTGSDVDSTLSDAIYSDYVLLPFKRLIDLQQTRGVTRWLNLVHPQAWVSPQAKIGRDVFVGANASIGALSTIGDHVRVNRNASIGHHVTLAEGVELGPGVILTSGTRVGSFSFIGAGAVVLNNVVIGSGATVAAGSVVTRDVPPGAVVVGSPARVRHKDGRL